MPTDSTMTFGFDELEKAFQKIESKYPDKTVAMLNAMGRLATNKVKALSPVLKRDRKDRNPGDLKKSWKLKSAKEYGKTIVVRVQSQAPHAHLVEAPHKIYTSPHKVKGRVNKYSNLQQIVRGIKYHGMTKGEKMLEKTMSGIRSSFNKSADKLLDDLTWEVEL